MKYIYLLALFISINSCSQNEKLNFENNGGMILKLNFDKTNIEFKEKIIQRVKFFCELNDKYQREYDFSSLVNESKNELIFKFPFLLTQKDLDKLILSKGEMLISKNNNYLKKDKIKKLETSFNQLLRRNIDVIFNNKEMLLSYLNNSLNEEIVMTVDKDTVSSSIIRQIPNKIEKLPFSISLNYNSEIIYTIVSHLYEKNLKIDLVHKNIYLNSAKGIIKMKPEMFSFYKKLRSLFKENYSLMYNILNEIPPTDKSLSKILLNRDLEFIIKHNFDDFLVASNFNNIDSLKDFFKQFKFINSYKNKFGNEAQEEILKIINIINKIENYK
ncbi:hypothetical protein SAMN05444344_1682 [Tenacibaculum mesophilum]|uniref:Uncharacterized protein n=1 Tax=Tenacibaculum mesophilum TaxID=104268 RepID=A0ABM7CDL9_9FLAO|nr:hypothetical protein [Tenacibaculum mesophilum]AZJ31852.1 hypothetical protein D6200_04415 [Tenacibaculum mesophilum]QFS27107.1 hypothetical protein F9Y86_01285 [Tenacibaculum mesophilum]SHF84896.1 hypothetical protein SAMN05444344_1682 [Tenacibaculum mesophilum]